MIIILLRMKTVPIAGLFYFDKFEYKLKRIEEVNVLILKIRELTYFSIPKMISLASIVFSFSQSVDRLPLNPPFSK